MRVLWTLCIPAAILLAACTQTETTQFSEGNLIAFNDPFVNNATKADLDETTFNSFYVYGARETSGVWNPFYTNVKVSGNGTGTDWTAEAKAYWETGLKHNFAAYSDGNAKIASGVSYDASAKTLKIDGYNAGENDLVVALSEDITPTSGTEKVNLSFKHALSKVKFTFKTEASADYTMAVTALSFSKAVKKGNAEITPSEIKWTGNTDSTYNYAVASLTDFAAAGGPFSSEMYVVPQSNESLEASITVSLQLGTEAVKTKTFTASLKYTDADGNPASNKWTEGYAYNYIATINPDDIDSNLEEIIFVVDAVEGWKPSEDQEPAPTPVP